MNSWRGCITHTGPSQSAGGEASLSSPSLSSICLSILKRKGSTEAVQVLMSYIQLSILKSVPSKQSVFQSVKNLSSWAKLSCFDRLKSVCAYWRLPYILPGSRKSFLFSLAFIQSCLYTNIQLCAYTQMLKLSQIYRHPLSDHNPLDACSSLWKITLSLLRCYCKIPTNFKCICD